MTYGRCLSIYKHTARSSVDMNLDFRIHVESALEKLPFVEFLQLEKKKEERQRQESHIEVTAWLA